MKEKPIKEKVAIAYVILLFMLIAIVGLLWQEERTMAEIAVKSDSIRVAHNEISTVHHCITELAMRGETAMAWTDEDKRKYDSLLAKTDMLLGTLTLTCRDYVNKEKIDSVRLLLQQKQEHIEWMMLTVRTHRQSDRRLLKQLPKATERATGIRTIRKRKSGLAGLLGGKKDVTIAPPTEARTQLNDINEKQLQYFLATFQYHQT